MVRVAVPSKFLNAYAQVPRRVQKKVREFTRKFMEDPTQASINYESIHGMTDSKVRTVRVGIDYRAIVIHPPKGDVYTLAWVDHHDEAMDWAKRKRFEVNPVLGNFQVYEAQDAGELEVDDGQQADDAVIPEEFLLAGRTRGELRACGVPNLLLPSVCAVRDDAELEALLPYLPAGLNDVLTMLAAGYPLAEAVQAGPAGVDEDDLESALAHPESQRAFKLLGADDDLDALLDAPTEATLTMAAGAGPAQFEVASEGSWPVSVEVDGEAAAEPLAPGAEAIFGRHETCAYVLADPHVSRRQFRVFNRGDRLEIEGLPSKNRTHVVGRRLDDGVYASSPEVWVRVGGSTVKLRRVTD